MSLTELDPLLSSPKRLACLGAIAAARELEFVALRELLEISDSDLSKQLKSLSDAGYVTARKAGRASTRTTWLAATKPGRAALADHVAALRKLTDPVALRARLPDPVGEPR